MASKNVLDPEFVSSSDEESICDILNVPISSQPDSSQNIIDEWSSQDTKDSVFIMLPSICLLPVTLKHSI